MNPTGPPPPRGFACVLAVDDRGGIGKGNDLPWPKLKGDLQHFRRLTSATEAPGRRNAVLMGRKTWDSIPPSFRPLPDRINVVISRGRVELPAGVLLASSLDDAVLAAERTPDIDRVFVVGGGEIYRLALEHPRCRDVFVTRIHGSFDCDTFVPAFDARFACAEVLGRHREAGLDYTIERWTRR